MLNCLRNQSSIARFIGLRFVSVVVCLFFAFSVKAQTDQLVYTDSLQNGWENYSWATVNFSNPQPVHGGAASVSVNAAAYQAIYLHHLGFSTDNYLSLNFWIHGGSTGGQHLQVQATSGGAPQTAVALQPLAANSWQQINLSLASLGVGAGASIDGFWIQDTTGGSQAVFYLDDIKLVGGVPPPPPPNSAVTVQVDVAANRHQINPQIYGLAYASAGQLLDLNAPLNRLGGNNITRYNWQLNADNKASDYYFESIASANTPGEVGDSFIQNAKDGGAEPMLTIPIIDWIAKVGANREKLASFSIAKYGAQTGSDQWFPDAGNGIRTNNQFVTGNDPNDANVPNSTTFQQTWVQHLTGRWGIAGQGGLRYYILDNEHSIWHGTHRDVHPTGATMDEIFGKMRDYALMIKNNDSGAQVLGPEEWGWSGYLYSGYDQQWGSQHGWSNLPDRAAHGNMDYVPWLLQQFKADEQTRGRRLLDVFTLHYYPQGGEFGNDVSPAMQQRRNRSTRSLWDPNYTDETWINDRVKLIPRMKSWVAQYYPGTKTGVTEYNWGAENHINGATTQADIYGIFGREGLDAAARWATPDTATPTYKAMKMYRNYDGNRSGFGDTSVSASIPNSDQLSAFAAVRTADGALTVMVINKILGETPVTLNLAGFSASGTAQVWQLTAGNQINRLADVNVSNNAVGTTVPSQSVTLFVVAANGSPLAAPSNLSGSVSHRVVMLNWQDNSADETGFIIERSFGPSTGGGAEFVEVGRVAANQINWQARSRYGSCFYRVRAVRNASVSTASNTVHFLVR